MSISCTICLSALKLDEDTVHSTSCGHVFHHQCLSQALRMSSGSCPHCRHANIQHFQLFFVLENNDDESDGDVAGAIRPANSNDSNFSKQMNEMSKKLDKINAKLGPNRGRIGMANDRGEVNMYRDIVDNLQRENQDLKEILEMEKILSTNTEKEIDQLKGEVRDRNDLINALQMQNDTLHEETQLYQLGVRPEEVIPIANLLDL